MRKLKDLKPNEVINPANAAEDKALRELMDGEGYNRSGGGSWKDHHYGFRDYGNSVCYDPIDGFYATKDYFTHNEPQTILPASDFLFNPQPGDMVGLSGGEQRVYIGTVNGIHYVISKHSENTAYGYSAIYPIPRKVTVTMAEIAEWKGCREDEIEIK